MVLSSIADVKTAGPLVEYERRIAAGELVDGDAYQVDTLRELQRLYDELVQSANACRLDRYSTSTKSGRQCSWRKKRIHFHDFMLNVHKTLRILVSTSNRAPDKLYEGGLQRDLFLPFIATLKAEQGFYFVGKDLSGFLKQSFQQLIGEHEAVPQEAEVVMGRTLKLVIYDIIVLSRENYHTLALEGVPVFGLHNRTAAYRFVTLVDVMYENKARLLCTAEGTPFELFEKVVTISDALQIAPRTSSRSRKNDDAGLCVDNELGFAKDRTISRYVPLQNK
ncbi:hypothetical protein DVH24_015457 [Malus domestica]|uniref:Uncharacterized protein n=1 Tax=Malus domestica TaxID=3750 RepID=A0A498HMR0_MALDO|nr:hypothetical protein DVH24_015457 [Malus domestica]